MPNTESSRRTSNKKRKSTAKEVGMPTKFKMPDFKGRAKAIFGNKRTNLSNIVMQVER